MGFELLLSKCINSKELNKEDIKGICKLLNDKTIGINDIIFSLESELVSPIVDQKKRGIEIIGELLWSYLPNDNFTSTHIKLISCFVLNYIYDWACIDSVISIIRCIFETQSPDVIKSVKIDIRDDENIFEEYFFNPVIEVKDENIGNINTDFGKIEILGENHGSDESRRYLKSYFEICSYHKFNNTFCIEDAKNDEDLYKMNLSFYLITQILYKVTTRQLVYSSRIIIIDFLLLILKDATYDDELSRLGPGIVPILIQHLENEKDPRVLIKAFPLMELMIKKFHNIITLYDKNSAGLSNSEVKIEYGYYQIYHGRIPKLEKEEERNLMDKYQSLLENNINFKNKFDNSLEDSEEDQSLKNNGEILSNLISETLFAYFPLQFNSPNINNKNQKGRIPKKDLKNAYFSVITCSNIIQDTLIQSIAEYVDTQGLLEDIEFVDESTNVINEYGQINDNILSKNYVNKEASNKPINMNKMDEEIFEDIISIFGMIKYEIDPVIINKYIPSVFLLLNELLKNTLISTDKIYKLLIIIFSIFTNLELGYKYGQSVVISSINKFVIPNILNKLNSSNQLDKFSFNILEVFVLTGNKAIIDNIKDHFLLKDITYDHKDIERINLNLKLLITIYIINSNVKQCSPLESDYLTKVSVENDTNSVMNVVINLDEYNKRVKGFLESTENNINNYIKKYESTKKANTKPNPYESYFSLAEICIYTIYNFELGFLSNFPKKLFDIIKNVWNEYCSLNENDKNYLLGLTSFFLVFKNDEAKNYWLSYYNNEDLNNYGNVYILEYALYTITSENHVMDDLISCFIENIKSNIVELINKSVEFIDFTYLNKKLANTIDILSSNKWKYVDLNKHLNFKLEDWVYTITHLTGLCFQTDNFNIFFFNNKNMYYNIFKNMAILTIKLFNIQVSGPKGDSILINQLFDIISDKILEIENKLFILVYINEFMNKLLIFDIKFNINNIGTIIDYCIEWVNEHQPYDKDDKLNKLINDEIEKFILNSLLMEKDIVTVKNSILSKLDQKNNVIIGKISRYYLFSQTKNFEIIYQEIKDSLHKMTIEKCSDDCKKNDNQSSPEEINNDYLDLELFDSIKLLYIIGSDMNLLKNQNFDNISLLFGNSRYIFESNNTENNSSLSSGENLRSNDELYFIPLVTLSNVSNFTTNILTTHSNHNNGKFLYQLLEYYISSFNINEATSNNYYCTNNYNEDSENSQNELLCNMWPTVIPLTDNSYPIIDFNNKLTQEKIIDINNIIVEHYKNVFLNRLLNYRNRTLFLIPLISSINNLNISTILKDYSSSMINSILFLSLFECTNYKTYKSTRCENTHLFNYIVDLTKIQNSPNNNGVNLKVTQEADNNLEMDSNLVVKLLKMKEIPKNNCTSYRKELFIFNIQSLSILMRIIHYSRENKFIIYENKGNGKHKLDFIFENLRIYSIFVLNIIENHPNSLVRFISLLIISQIFKFPSVFRTNTKNIVLKTLAIASNNDPNKYLRELSSILKLKIVTMNDHIYI
ncbi:hypothetical protein FG379_002449 [Cryptosporidium bovis]|uniref:uncharacterized protein n=1 Tax=Cryptosporidium bovis TaxID=310047 RepID=UPI00351A455F|nr:hypothetical protein FG379_002449 [Cryptosporidium bovis]